LVSSFPPSPTIATTPVRGGCGCPSSRKNCTLINISVLRLFFPCYRVPCRDLTKIFPVPSYFLLSLVFPPPAIQRRFVGSILLGGLLHLHDLSYSPEVSLCELCPVKRISPLLPWLPFSGSTRLRPVRLQGRRRLLLFPPFFFRPIKPGLPGDYSFSCYKLLRHFAGNVSDTDLFVFGFLLGGVFLVLVLVLRPNSFPGSRTDRHAFLSLVFLDGTVRDLVPQQCVSSHDSLFRSSFSSRAPPTSLSFFEPSRLFFAGASSELPKDLVCGFTLLLTLLRFFPETP